MEEFFLESSLVPKRAISTKRALCSATLAVSSSSFESQEGTLSLRWTKLCSASICGAMRGRKGRDAMLSCILSKVSSIHECIFVCSH